MNAGVVMATPMMQRRRWLLDWKPAASIETVAAVASLYFAIVSNGAFWRATAATGVLGGLPGLGTATSLFVAMVALNMLLLCVMLTRWTTKPVLSLLLVVNAAVGYFASKYGIYVDPGMVRNVVYTDAGESAELVTTGLAAAILVKGVVPAALLWRVRLRRRTWARAAGVRLAWMAAAVLVTAAALMLSFQDISSLMRTHKSLRYLITPGNYLVSTARVMLDGTPGARGIRRAVAPDARQAAHTAATKPHLLVIVVGETVRAQNWGLSGYSRQTTPQLARLDVINFTDVTACGSNTEVSVPCLFSLQGRRNYDQAMIRQSESLLHVLERAGIKTLWRDNQTGCKGVCAGLAFESYRQPRQDPLCDRQGCRDTIMLQGLHQAIKRNPGDVVVVLHQLGNHGPSYFRRYPPALRVFRPDCRTQDLGECSQQQVVNAYDNAILATDDFLARTIALLAADTSHDTGMIYVSDHGESLGERNLYLHGLPYAIAPDTQLRVPMVVWLSPGMEASRRLDTRCLQRRARQPASHDNLFHSVLGLLQVESRDYEAGLDFFASCRDSAQAHLRPPLAAPASPAAASDEAGRLASPRMRRSPASAAASGSALLFPREYRACSAAWGASAGAGHSTASRFDGSCITKAAIQRRGPA